MNYTDAAMPEISAGVREYVSKCEAECADVFRALDEVGYTGTYSMELIWRAFGIPLMKDHAAFSVKVLRQAQEESNAKT